MLLFRNTSIRQRLTLIIMGISCASVLATAIAISVMGVFSLRGSILTELDILATIMGERNKAAITFGAKEQAKDNLNILGANDSIMQACLYDEFGAQFTHYASENHKNATCPPALTERAVIKKDTMEVVKNITGDSGIVGTIYLESTLEQIDKYIQKQSSIAMTVAIGAFLLSYLLAINLQKTISHPILSLTAVARAITEEKDYSLRAPQMGNPEKEHKNEMILLTQSFNNMLTEIGVRDGQLKAQNVELERSRDAAESSNRSKSQFLANISHELRTPLNAIIGFSSILLNQLFGALGDPKYLEYAKDINESGTHLLDIINDILDLSKAEAGKLSLAYEEVHVAKAIQKCVTILSDRAAKGEVTIVPHIPKSLPLLVVDRLRFIQIILNVLSNAVKFTNPGGTVDIIVETRDINGTITHFIVTAKDNGIGMSQDDIDEAFQSFGQVDSGLNRKYEGTGLGLPLTKKLLELHDGTIHIESALGQGTSVILTFPAVPPEGYGTDQGSLTKH